MNLAMPHILVVDDEAANRRVAQLLLERAGYTVSTADSGADALTLLGEQQVDLILLDLSMPAMSGYDVCTQIRERQLPKRPVLVAYTAHVLPAELAAVQAAGFDDVLLKPISQALLLNCVRRWSGND